MFIQSSNMNTNNRIKKINTSKSSDRRLAAGRQAASYLHSALTSSSSTNPSALRKQPPPTTHVSTDKTVKRSHNGKSWEDLSLLDWNPNYFRLYVGNLGDDVTDQMLHDSFAKYPAMTKVKVPTDNRTGKPKGFGFVEFSTTDDYMRAYKEMNGKYVGLHPVQLLRATTKIKASKKKR